MKKYGLGLLLMLISFTAMSQKAMIVFDNVNYEFGKINEEDGKVTHVFNFTNKGNAPLVVNRVQASCGCTTPTWTKEPIEPGKPGSITVTYNPAGRPGVFTKSITVYSNAADEQTVLLIKGEVATKAQPEISAYPETINGLLFQSKIVQMNNIDKGKVQVRTLDIKNSTNATIKPTIENLPVYMSVTISPESVSPNAEGKITFTYNSLKSSQWGPFSNNLYVVLNGQKKLSDDYKITIVGNVIEDFSKITLDQKRNSPILEISQKTIQLGDIKQGQKRKSSFKISNKGINTLEIRRIINNNKEISTYQSTFNVQKGKAGLLNFDLNTANLSPGEYKKSITIQTNDPDNSFLVLVIGWTVK